MGVVHKMLSRTILHWAMRFLATALSLPNTASQKQKMPIYQKIEERCKLKILFNPV
jgi:preprotein translocase subunit SecG